MYYRRKIILALLQLFEGQLDKIRLQKLLFLFTRRQSQPVYDFVPHQFGCFSYSANADMTAMVTRGYLTEQETSFTKADPSDMLRNIRLIDLELLMAVKQDYGHLSTADLIRYTYLQHPFYAINSEVASDILNTEQVEFVERARPRNKKTILFTIGYEGISLETYIVRLLQHDVRVLVDVRHNPLSMKYGFSKSQLSKYCSSAGIGYAHIPEVGIRGDQRKSLRSQLDYDELFDVYRSDHLPATREYQKKIMDLLRQHKRIALTCFEANICQCHRKPLAEAIQNHSEFSYEVKHI